MKVGISILTHAGHNVWNNGIGQNVYFLAQCLAASPFVDSVFVVNCGDQSAPPNSSGSLGEQFKLIPLAEASDAVDVVIEMGGALDLAWKIDFKARGGRIIYHNCGQPYAALIEPSTFGKLGCFSTPGHYDEVWLLPKDRQFTAMQRAIHRQEVIEVPYLWAPDFLIESGTVQADEPLGYKIGSLADGNIRPAIFEPNISPIKMGTIPLLICEEVERISPNRIAAVDFMNGVHLRETLTFAQLSDNLNLSKAGKLRIKAREYVSDIFKSGANMVVSHQIEVEQNYLYLDTLYGGYPLIHNSRSFADVGYYYEESDIAAGVTQVLNAALYHDLNLHDYKSRALRKIASVDPLSRANIDHYSRRLHHVMDNLHHSAVLAS